jgi:hypothetical protein
MPLVPVRSSSSSSGNLSPAASAPATQFDSGDQCVFDISGTTDLGPNTGQTFQGTLSLGIGPDGAIDSGTLQLADGTTVPLVGQAIGRSLRLRVGSDAASVVTFTGSGVSPLDECAGIITGAFVGPGLQNVGVWTATARSGA